MSVPEVIDICMCFNRTHFPGALAAIRSILSNTERPGGVSFHFMVGVGESRDFQALIRKCFPISDLRYRIEEFRSTPFLEDFILAGQDFTYASPESQVMNFSRFYLSRIYPELGKLIYLDADLIVQGDVAELYELATLESQALAAVAFSSFDAWSAGIKKSSPHVRHFDFDQPVFNAGVYVTDLRIWREQGILQQLEDWIRIQRQSLEDFSFGTQSTMNLAFYQNLQLLPPEWNVQPLGIDEDVPEETLRAAKILHWAGKRKPWTADGLYKEYWNDYAFRIELSEKEAG